MRWATHAAYFSTIPRIWEFAVGGALALALPPALRLPKAVSLFLTCGGLAAIVAGALLFTEDMAYPGILALAPTLGTVAVLVAGTATVKVAPIRLLSRPSLQYLGDLSYAWYLWHWPVLVFARAASGERLTGIAAVAVIALSGIPTVISHHLIENPLRYSQSLAQVPRRSLTFGAASVAAAVGLAFALTALQPRIPTAPAEAVTGAEAAIKGEVTLQRVVAQVRPDPRARRRTGEGSTGTAASSVRPSASRRRAYMASPARSARLSCLATPTPCTGSRPSNASPCAGTGAWSP